MSQFAEGDKVVLASNPSQEMTVVEVQGDTVVVSYQVDGKRKMAKHPIGEIKKP